MKHPGSGGRVVQACVCYMSIKVFFKRINTYFGLPHPRQGHEIVSELAYTGIVMNL